MQEARLFKNEPGASSMWYGQGSSEAGWSAESFSKLHPRSASFGIHETLPLPG